jgi:hypothetical protein
MQHAMPGFVVRLRPSRIAALLLFAATLALLAAMLLTDVPAVFLLGFPCLAASLLRQIGARRIRALEICADGRVQVQIGTRFVPVVVRDDSVAWPWLVVLNLSLAGRRRGLCVFVDSSDAESRRKLRVYLRWPPMKAIVPVSRYH